MRQLFLFILIASLTSCQLFGGKKIRGNGKVISEAIKTEAFTSVTAGGAIKLHLKQDQVNAVKVETDENLMEYLNIHVSGSKLIIEPKDGYNLNPTREVNVYVSAKELEKIEVTGASMAIAEDPISVEKLAINASGASEIRMTIKAMKIESDLSGASTLQLKGEVDRFSGEASGASNILCADLMTQESDIDVSGASKAQLSVNKKLTVEASGASSVEYKGEPNVNQKSSGASSVNKIS